MGVIVKLSYAELLLLAETLLHRYSAAAGQDMNSEPESRYQVTHVSCKATIGEAPHDCTAPEGERPPPT